MHVLCVLAKITRYNCAEAAFAELGSKNRNDFFPIYIGDDRTDEDAFKVSLSGFYLVHRLETMFEFAMLKELTYMSVHLIR